MQKIEEVTIDPPWRKWFKRDNLIVLVLAGILLFVIALPTEDKEKRDNSKTSACDGARTDGTTQKESGMNVTSSTTNDLEKYAALQEEKLETLLSAMSGVGSVEVMLTFASSEELVVEKDAPVVRSNTVENDSAGGSRTVTQFESGDTTVYSNVSGDSIPYVIKTMNPEVEGVLVVAQGAGNSSVNRDISEAVCALFGVESHKVKVVPMGS